MRLYKVELKEVLIMNDRIVMFNGKPCFLEISEYTDGNICLDLVCRYTNELVACATTNDVSIPVPKGYILIKDYHENEGMLKQLLDQRIICDTMKLDRVHGVYMCRLL